jgi:hypothetical protein
MRRRRAPNPQPTTGRPPALGGRTRREYPSPPGAGGGDCGGWSSEFAFLWAQSTHRTHRDMLTARHRLRRGTAPRSYAYRAPRPPAPRMPGRASLPCLETAAAPPALPERARVSTESPPPPSDARFADVVNIAGSCRPSPLGGGPNLVTDLVTTDAQQPPERAFNCIERPVFSGRLYSGRRCAPGVRRVPLIEVALLPLLHLEGRPERRRCGCAFGRRRECRSATALSV